MRDGRSERAMTNPEVADEADGGRCIRVTVDHRDFKQIIFGIGHELAAHLSRASALVIGDQLSIQCLDHVDFCSLGRHGKIGSAFESGAKEVDYPALRASYVAPAAFGNQSTLDIGL